MDCPLCGEVCRCHLEPPPSSSRWRPDAAPSAPATPFASFSSQEVATSDSSTDARAEAAEPELSNEQDASVWRGELSAKLNRYRSRRKMRPPRYPSLSLPFDAVSRSENTIAESQPTFEPLTDRGLALDSMVEVPPIAEPAPADLPSSSVENFPVHAGAKIIEFPRFAWGPPAPPPDQLAEPVMDRPRILEVPEEVAPLPALGGITMEAAEKQDAEKRPGIDLPLQTAPLALRVMAAAIDGLVLLAASALFAFIFWKVAAIRPPQIQMIGLAFGVPGIFWVLFQYLLMVYAATSPGLRAVGLELVRFDGAPTNRKLRRWRVLASCLSAVSLGMGFAWVFLDEDALCWHDRITHTYLAPRKPDSATK